MIIIRGYDKKRSVSLYASNAEQKLRVLHVSTYFYRSLQFLALLAATVLFLNRSFPKGLNTAGKVRRCMSPPAVVIMMTFKEGTCRFFKCKENISCQRNNSCWGGGKLHCVGVCVMQHTKALSLPALSGLFFSYVTAM
jgi:hypothetical protein